MGSMNMTPDRMPDEENAMNRRVRIELDDKNQLLEAKEDEISWLRKQLHNQKIDAESDSKPDPETPTQIYRGFKLTRTLPYRFWVTSCLDGGKLPFELEGSYTMIELIKKRIDDYKNDVAKAEFKAAQGS